MTPQAGRSIRGAPTALWQAGVRVAAGTRRVPGSRVTGMQVVPTLQLLGPGPPGTSGTSLGVDACPHVSRV